MDKKLIKKIVNRNSKEYNILKTIEELNELSTALAQTLNKPYKDYSSSIIEEIGDVKIRIKMLEEIFSKKSIKERIEFKLNKFKEYLENNSFPNI